MGYFILVVLNILVAFILFTSGITVSPEAELRNSTDSTTRIENSRKVESREEILVDGNNVPLSRNQSTVERYRRLIPYMTFYLPSTNDLKLPINQAYNFMPAGPSMQFHMQYQPIPSSHSFQLPQKLKQLMLTQTQHSPQTKPVIYLTTKFQTPSSIRRPLPHLNPTLMYNNLKHLQHSDQEIKGFSTPAPQIIQPSTFNNIKYPTFLSQQPDVGVITQNYFQAQKPIISKPPSPTLLPSASPSIKLSSGTKVNFTPFLPANKLPGNFVPIQPNIHYNDENNLVYQNHNSNGNNHNGAGVIGFTSVNNNQHHNHNNNNNNIKRPSTGKPVFVTTTPSPTLDSDDFKHYYGATKVQHQTPASVFYSTPATKLLAQDIVLPNTKYAENYNKHKLIYKDSILQRPHSVKYILKEHKATNKPFNHAIVDLSTKDKDFVKGTPVLVTTATPIYVTTVAEKYRPHFAPAKDPELVRPIVEKPYYPSTTNAPMYTQNYIEKLPIPVPSPPPVSTYRPNFKTYYIPSQDLLEYTPIKSKPENVIHDESEHTTTTTTRRPYATVTITPPEDVSHPEYDGDSLATLLKKLQETNHLPETLTPDNIDNSIRTLVKILNNLKKSKDRYKVTPKPEITDDYDYKYYDEDIDVSKPNSGAPGPNSGRPGIDYPVYAEIPETNFMCKEQRYKGFFGDPETNCQVWHYCDLNGGKASFLCPNGTIFSQVALTCDWWFNVKCSNTAQQYVLNERLYKYILPFTPKFPEDYSGPLVDKYLAQKFEEMEETLRRQKEKGLHKQHENDDDDEVDENNELYESNTESTLSKNTQVTVAETDEHEFIGPTIYVTTEASSSDSINSNNIISSTAVPQQQQQQQVPSPHPKTIVESEQLHVIEIKTDGSSGHLVRSTEGGDYGE